MGRISGSVSDDIDRVNDLLSTVDYMLEYSVSLLDASKICSNYSSNTILNFIHHELKDIDGDKYKQVLLLLAKNKRKNKRSGGSDRAKRVNGNN